MSVRLVMIGTIVIVIPFFTLLLFEALAVLFDSTVDDVMQISIIPVPSSTVFLQWSETTY
jgi:hypothetical protein